MTEPDMQAVRDRLERQEEQQREERQMLSRDYKHQAMLIDALNLSIQVGKFGLLPTIAWLFYAASKAPAFDGVGILFFGGIATLFVYFLGSYVSSLLAYCWFRETQISVPRTAMVLTLLVDAAYFGWVVVLTYPRQ